MHMHACCNGVCNCYSSGGHSLDLCALADQKGLQLGLPVYNEQLGLCYHAVKQWQSEQPNSLGAPPEK